MTQSLITTDIALGQCRRCEGYVWSCVVGGLSVAAEPVTLTVETFRDALLGGRECYQVLYADRRPHRLRRPVGGAKWDQSQTFVAEHRCGALARDAGRVEMVPPTPLDAPVTHGGPKAGLHHPDARPGASQGLHSLPAGSATRPRSESRPARWRWPRCDKCRDWIKPGEPHVGIEYGAYAWFQHADCRPDALDVLLDPTGRDRDWDAAVQLSQAGIAHKEIETIQLPEFDEE